MNTRHLAFFASFCMSILAGLLVLFYWHHSHLLSNAKRYDAVPEGSHGYVNRTWPEAPRKISLTAFYNLPLSATTTEFNVAKMDSKIVHSFAPDALMLSVGSRFADDNKITTNQPFGHFVLDIREHVLGLRLLPSSRDDYNSPELGWVRNNDGVVRFKPQRAIAYEWLNGEIGKSEYEYSLRNLISLKSLDHLAFVDFGIAGFTDGFWETLEEVAATVGIRGLVVRRGNEFLQVRNGRIIPSITGLVITIDEIEDIRSCGNAFPNLRFLYLHVPHSVIGKLGVVLSSAFPNLEALMFSPCSPMMEPADWLGSVAGGPPVRMVPEMFPRKLRWLCFDGSLLSLQSMAEFDFLSRRYEGPQTSRPRGQIECVFVGIGYSTVSARFLRRDEYSTLESYWLR